MSGECTAIEGTSQVEDYLKGCFSWRQTYVPMRTFFIFKTKISFSCSFYCNSCKLLCNCFTAYCIFTTNQINCFRSLSCIFFSLKQNNMQSRKCCLLTSICLHFYKQWTAARNLLKLMPCKQTTLKLCRQVLDIFYDALNFHSEN